MVCIGCFNSKQPGISRSRAAIERRPPVIVSRNSPLQTSVIKGVITHD